MSNIKIIQRSGLIISRKYENEPFYKQIKKHLERDNEAYQTGSITTNRFFIESNKFLIVPRWFDVNRFIPAPQIIDMRHVGRSIFINHKIQPRSELQKAAMSHMIKNNKGIIQLAPGVGKTVISIYVIAERKINTIILVHRNALSDQWKERLLQFTDLKETEIAQLKTRSYKKDIHKSIVICTVQTFVSLLKNHKQGFLTELDKANIGMMIADEVHTTVGAPRFAECSIHVPAKITFGLSATPYRYDGNDDIIRYHLGEVFSEEDFEDTMDAHINVLLLDYEIDVPKSQYYLYWGGEFQRSRYLNKITKSEPFIKTIKGLLNQLTDRQVIVMMERVKLIDKIYNWFDFKDKSRFYRSETTEKLEAQITFTTPGKCRDGIDAPQKDCMIVTSPIANIEQLIGRITRSKEGKKTPIVFDMVDYGCKRISRTLYRRLDYYAKKGWQVDFLIVKNGKINKIDKNEAIQIIMQRDGG